MRLLFALLALLPIAAHAAWERTGTTPSGAIYRIAVPESWRVGDGLVVYQHDLAFETTDWPDLGPLLQHQLEHGYAVAASGYRHSGWAAFAATQDNRELIERFGIEVGDPGTVFTYGTGMGGHLALQMADDPELAVDGVLALCPVVTGHRLWDSALDLRVVYDAVCAEVPGGRLPAATDLPWLVAADDVSPAGLERTVLAVNQCLGTHLPPGLRSEAQQRRLDAIAAVVGISDPDGLLLQLGYATLGLSDLMRDPGKLAGAAALGNAGVDYGDTAINDRVRRIDDDPFAALSFRVDSSPGGLGNGKVLSLHAGTDAAATPHDPLRQWLPAQRLASAVVNDGTGQCHLTDAELASAWHGLEAWVDGDPKPDAIELQAQCLASNDAGIVEGPCRIDAEQQSLSPTTTFRSRNRAIEQVDARFSGSWYDPDRSGEGWLIEVLDEHTAQVYGFTFPIGAEAGEQLWLTGTGRIDGDGIVIDQLHRLEGGHFAFAGSAPLHSEIWGRAEIVFPACGEARMRVHGSSGYDSHERALVQLTSLADHACSEATPGSDPATDLSGFTGSFYDPAAPGQGVVISVGENGVAMTLMFTFDGNGHPIWLVGEGRIDAEGRLHLASPRQPTGTRYDDFDPAQVARTLWGEVVIAFDGCDRATLRYRSDLPGYGNGTWPLTRLTRPSGIGTCPLSAGTSASAQ